MRLSSRFCLILLIALPFIYFLFFIAWYFYTLIYFPYHDLSLNEMPTQSQPTSVDNPPIPRIIHQLYMTSDVTQLPPHWKQAYDSCQKVITNQKDPNTGANIEYKYILWNDTSMDTFMTEKFPEVWKKYKTNFRFNIQRIDAFRYYLLYDMGGLYIDMDIGCNRPLEPLFWIKGAALPLTQPFGVSNDMMISPKKHAFFRMAIDEIFDVYNWDWGLKSVTVLLSTGPAFVDRLIRSYSIRLEYLLKSTQKDHSFVSNSPEKALYVLPGKFYSAPPNPFFFHVFGSSWHSYDSTAMNYLWHHWKLIVLWAIILIIVAILLKSVLLRQRKSEILSLFNCALFRRKESGDGAVNGYDHEALKRV